MPHAPWILNFVFWTIGIGVPALQNIKNYLQWIDPKTRFNFMHLIVYQKKSIKSSLFENSFKLSQKQEKQSNTITVLFRMKGIEFPIQEE